MTMKIGVFDSGKGGAAVAAHLRGALPDQSILFVDDHQHVPYGTRTPEEVLRFTKRAIQPLLREGCNPIVLACNTATAVAIDALRAAYPSTNFVGIEPMVKPAAAQSRTKRIAVLATPGTLASARYQALKQQWAHDCIVIEPDCSDWATRIEAGAQSSIPIERVVQELVAQSVDGIVLGCTHYHWLADRARIAADGRAIIYEPSEAVALRISEIRSKAASPQQ